MSHYHKKVRITFFENGIRFTEALPLVFSQQSFPEHVTSVGLLVRAKKVQLPQIAHYTQRSQFMC